MELSEPLKALLIEAAMELKGRARRAFMARTVKALGPGGQRRAERELGWCRVTIRKGMRELGYAQDSGAAGAGPHRMCAEARLPNLLADISAIVEQDRRGGAPCRDDPRAAGLSAREVRRRLIAQKGYSDAELPTAQTIAAKLRSLGYRAGRSQDRAADARRPAPDPPG